MSKKGFLLVLMQPPAGQEEEFNAWYDLEHVPDRMSLPGFLAGRRYICVEGAPRYMAMYDLESPGAVDTPQYNAISGANATPWTRRAVAHARNYRATGPQLIEGQTLSPPAARVLLIRFRGAPLAIAPALAEGMKANFAGRPEVAQARLLEHPVGEGLADYILFIESRAPTSSSFDVTAFGDHARFIDLVSSYAPMWN